MTFFDAHTHHYNPLSVFEKDVFKIYSFGLDEFRTLEKPGPLFFMVGLHPWFIRPNWNESKTQLYEIWSHFRQCVAIGETGLDKIRGPQFESQWEAFNWHVEVAYELKKPLVLHCVKAWQEVYSTLKKYQGLKVMFHDFQGKCEQVNMFQRLQSEMFFSFSPRHSQNRHDLWNSCEGFRLLESDDSGMPIQSVYERYHVTSSQQAELVSTAQRLFQFHPLT
jgi:TatD DNase family protein